MGTADFSGSAAVAGRERLLGAVAAFVWQARTPRLAGRSTSVGSWIRAALVMFRCIFLRVNVCMYMFGSTSA